MLCEVESLLSETLQKAFEQLKEGFFESAIEDFTLCILSEPDEVRAYEGRALAHFQLKNWNEAVSDFRKAKELNPENPENWIGLGMSLAIINEIYPAIDVLEALLLKFPQYVRGHIQLARLYYQLGIIKKGHRQLDIGLASRPSLLERRIIENLKKEQMTLDKKRFYRPDFEELHRKNKESDSFLKQFFQSIKKNFRNKND